ncbi:MAG: leucine-rich repeat protein [Clostridiaceae bacterium]|jgi:uncharacterized repeat protein (TIGR02543 family)|nr:leucine-rich repeat protein [Clostridiaceae bacterium]
MLKRFGKFGRLILAVALAAVMLAAFASCIDADSSPVRNFSVEGPEPYYIDDGFFYNEFTLHAVRENGKEFTVPLEASMISETERELLKEAGTHSVTISYGGVEVKYTFDLRKRTAEYYTITFNENGGKKIPAKTYALGSRFESFTEIPATERPYHTLVGWRVQDVNGVLLSLTSGFDTAFLINKDFTFIAEWVRNTVAVNFDIALYPGETSIAAPATQTIETSVGKVVQPSGAAIARVGYSLDGWYTARTEVSSSEYGFDMQDFYNFNIPVGDSNFTLYAKWSLKKHSITLVPDNGVSSYVPDGCKDIGYAADISALKPANPTKANYAFVDWFENRDFSGDPFEFDNMPDRNLTLYARWNPDLAYIFDFELLVNKTLRITGTKDKSFTHITIPATAEYEGITYPISEIGEKAFWQCAKLVEVTFPANSAMKRIGAQAFAYANALRSFAFLGAEPAVEYVGRDAFLGTAWFNGFVSADDAGYVTLGNVLVAYVGASDMLIMNSGSVGALATPLPANITAIATGAFNGLAHLAYIEIADSIEMIETDAFINCDALDALIFTVNSNLVKMNPGSVNKTPWYMNSRWSDKDYMVICGGVLYAYKGDTATTSVTVPGTVNRIEANAFYGYRRLASVVFENESAIIGIGENAFDGESPFILNAGAFASVNGIIIKANSSEQVIRVPSTYGAVAAGAFKTTVRHIVFEGDIKLYANVFSAVHSTFTVSFINDGNLDLSNPAPGSVIEEGAFALASGASVGVYVPAHKYAGYIAAPVWNFYTPILTSLTVDAISVADGTLRNRFPNDITLVLATEIDGATLRLLRNDGVTYDVPLLPKNFYDYDVDVATTIDFGTPGAGTAVISYKDMTRGNEATAPYVSLSFAYIIDAKLTGAVIGVTETFNTLKTAAFVEIGGVYYVYDAGNPEHASETVYYSTLRDKYFPNAAIELSGLVLHLSFNGGEPQTLVLTRYESATGVATFEERTAGGQVIGTVSARLAVVSNVHNGTAVPGGGFNAVAVGGYAYTLRLTLSNGDRADVALPDGNAALTYVVKVPEVYAVQIRNVKTRYNVGETINFAYGAAFAIVREDGTTSQVSTASPNLTIPTGDTTYPILNNGVFNFASLNSVLGESEYVDGQGVLHRKAVFAYNDSGRIVYTVFDYEVVFTTHAALFTASVKSGYAVITGTVDSANVSIDGRTTAVLLPNTLVIPETIVINGNTYTVKEIAENAFRGKNTVNFIYVPYTVEAVGAEAFANTTALKRVLFASKLKETGGAFLAELDLSASLLKAISDRTFMNAAALDTTVLPVGATALGERSFENTVSLQLFEVPAGSLLTALKAGAFKGSGLEQLNLTNASIDVVGDSLFMNGKIRTVVFGSTSFTKIPNDMFRNASLFGGFTTFPASVTEIADYAFANSGNALAGTSANGQSFVISAQITTIGAHAFDNTKALYSLDLSGAAGLTSIGAYAFYQSGSADLGSVAFPAYLQTIGAYAFAGSALKAFTLSGTTPLTIGAYAFADSGIIGAITLTNNIVALGQGIFAGSVKLAGVTFAAPYYETGFKITANAAVSTGGLYTVTNNVVMIPAYMFDGCVSLTSVVVTGGVTVAAVGDYAFNNAKVLNVPSLPVFADITYIGARAFAGTASVNIPALHADAVIGDRAFADNKNLTSLSLLSGISGGRYGIAPFAGCTGIATLYSDGGISETYKLFATSYTDVPASLKKLILRPRAGKESDQLVITHDAFRNMIFITEIDFSEFVTYYMAAKIHINSGAFNGMSSITELTLPVNVESVGGTDYTAAAAAAAKGETYVPAADATNGAFTGAKNLRALNLPAHIRFMDLFFTELDFDAVESNEKEVATLQAEVTRLANDASATTSAKEAAQRAYDASKAKLDKYTNGIKLLPGNLNHVDITLGSTATEKTVAGESFRGAKTILSVTLPDGLLEIGEGAFTDCTSITAIVIPESVTVYNPAFGGCTALTTLTFKSTAALNFSDLFPATEASSANDVKGFRHVGAPASLSRVILSGNSTAISEYGFGFASDVEVRIDIPSSVTTIHPQAFIGTPVSSFRIYEVGTDKKPVLDVDGTWKFNPVTSPFKSEASSLYNQAGDTLLAYATALPNHNFTLQANVNDITPGAFAYAKHLTSFAVAERTDKKFSVDTSGGRSLLFYPQPDAPLDTDKRKHQIIAYAAASGGLEYSVTFSDTKIWDYAFAGTSGLKTVIFSSGIPMEIGRFAFADTGITGTFTLPAATYKIGDYAFMNMKSITSAEIRDFSVAGETMNLETGSGVFFGTRLNHITLPFLGNNKVGSASASLNYTFGGLNSYVPSTLTSVKINGGTIGGSAFNGLNKITSLEIGSDTVVNAGALAPLTGLTRLTLGRLTTNVGQLFSASATVDNQNGFVPASLGYVGVLNGTVSGSAFKGLTNLKEVYLGNEVTYIGERAFAGTTGLTSLYIGDKVTTIGTEAFSGCAGLMLIYIPASVTTIGANAFAGLTINSSIRCAAASQPVGWATGWNGSALVTYGQGR